VDIIEINKCCGVGLLNKVKKCIEVVDVEKIAAGCEDNKDILTVYTLKPFSFQIGDIFEIRKVKH
jgi:hypothetical protein